MLFAITNLKEALRESLPCGLLCGWILRLEIAFLPLKRPKQKKFKMRWNDSRMILWICAQNTERREKESLLNLHLQSWQWDSRRLWGWVSKAKSRDSKQAVSRSLSLSHTLSVFLFSRLIKFLNSSKNFPKTKEFTKQNLWVYRRFSNLLALTNSIIFSQAF